MTALPFDSLYRHGFARVAVAVPKRPGRRPDLQRRAHPRSRPSGRRGGRGADASSRSWACPPTPTTTCSTRTRCWTPSTTRCAAVVGAERRARLGAPRRRAAARCRASCSTARVVVHRGEVLGVVPKSYLPNYREFYEKRQFAAAREALVDRDRPSPGSRSRSAPTCSSPRRTCPDFVVHVEICEDVLGADPAQHVRARWRARRCWSNLSASNITIGKADYRRQLCASQSARCIAAYLYSGGGARRVDHRPRLGRPRADRRERRRCSPRASASPPTSSSCSPTSTCERLVADRHARRRASPTACTITASGSRGCAAIAVELADSASGPLPLQRDDRALPLRARRPAHARTSAAPRSYAIQVAGPGDHGSRRPASRRS